MGKKLVEVSNLDSVICDGKVYADGSIILTPGAKDALSKRGIAIVYGSRPAGCEAGADAHAACCPAGCTCPACAALAACQGATSVESLVVAVTEILKNQYHITDAEQLKTVSCQVLKTIRDNI